MSENTIQNKQIHTYQGVMVSAFGEEGAARLVPLSNDKPGEAIILDKDAVDQLIYSLCSISLGASNVPR